MTSSYATLYVTATQVVWALSSVLWLGLSAAIRMLQLQPLSGSHTLANYLPHMATFEVVVLI